jgi:hypothetical protein
MYNETENTWKEAAVVEFTILPSNLPAKSEKNHVISVTTACLRGDIYNPASSEYGMGVLTTRPEVCGSRNFRNSPGPAQGPSGTSPKFVCKCVVTHTRQKPDYIHSSPNEVQSI